MEFASLGNLEQQERKSPFTLPEIEVVIYQALNALGHLHACDIVHYDINPENILVSSSPCPAIDTHHRRESRLPCSCRDSLAAHHGFVSTVAFSITAAAASDR